MRTRPPEYRRWSANKRIVWDHLIRFPRDSFMAVDLNILSGQKVGRAMSELCDAGYFSKHKEGSYSRIYIYSVEHPFMAYKVYDS